MAQNYKVKATGVVFNHRDFGTVFPNTSVPSVLSEYDLAFLGLELLAPDPEPPVVINYTPHEPSN